VQASPKAPTVGACFASGACTPKCRRTLARLLSLNFNNKKKGIGMNKNQTAPSDNHLSFNLPGTVLMEDANIMPLTTLQYAKITKDIDNEADTVVHGEMIAAKCARHPEHGNIVLVSTAYDGCLMIHFQSTPARN
jgi:hypothetical protein